MFFNAKKPKSDKNLALPDFDLESDLQVLRNLRLKFPKKFLIGYLNINSLRNKIIDLREVMQVLQLDYFVVSETKLDNSFPSAQFYLSDYEIRCRKDRDKNGGGLIEYIRRGVICKRLKQFESNVIEAIFSELTISKKKWFCMSIYRPPTHNNLSCFFEEITLSLSKASTKYENFMIMGDFNIDINISGIGKEKLDEFKNLFDLTNLIKEYTCITKDHRSTIDLMLTNRPLSFQKTKITETGLSDYHMLISSFFKSQYFRMKPKIINYRSYLDFNQSAFLKDLENKNLSINSNNVNTDYDKLCDTFSDIVEKHAPMKKKVLRGNHSPFVTKEFRKAIYTRSRLRNKYRKNPTVENQNSYKIQRNKCVSI